MKGSIQSLHVACFIHQTEDEEKVEGALAWLVGSGAPPEAEALEGHFGNAIRRVELNLTGKEAEAGLRQALSRMPRTVAEEISGEISSRMDEHGALFIRLDKQQLVLGRVALGSADSVRLKVKPRVDIVRGGAREFYLRLLQGG
ncbi:MAG: hypothetical protein JRN16_02920 [Nitrososphaerota archaeon]|nr:hypothetical protein [Nitrososphaerota archaeon]MDG7019852.1 hypothetical protein [Nitrososphaerota archaeon]MDG7027344.1 hypothetical protein [Nitrososphaerota archaeon]